MAFGFPHTRVEGRTFQFSFPLPGKIQQHPKPGKKPKTPERTRTSRAKGDAAQHSSRTEHRERDRPIRKESTPKDSKPKVETRAKEPKEPRSKGTPLTPEQKREKQRVRDYADYANAKAVGQCRKPTCEERAIPGQTRCETHAEEHRIWRREYDRKRYATAKESKSADIPTK